MLLEAAVIGALDIHVGSGCRGKNFDVVFQRGLKAHRQPCDDIGDQGNRHCCFAGSRSTMHGGR